MPGAYVAKLLTEGGEDTFHQLYHGYSEIILSRAAPLVVYPQGNEKILSRMPPETVTDSEKAKHYRRTNLKLAEIGETFAQEIREFFWKFDSQGDEKTLHDSLKRRWWPMDAAAWDRFFGEFNDFMNPPMANIHSLLGDLDAIGDFGGVYREQPFAEFSASCISEMYRALEETEFFLDADQYSAYLENLDQQSSQFL